jgi:anti-sigma factor RsiW
MVSDTHPHDIELFEYVEGELAAPRRDEIAAHLATCRVCAEQVELATAGRQALRGVGLTELPAGRREDILKSLPAQEPERVSGERRGFFPRGLLVGMAVLLVAAAFTAVLVKGGGNSGQESSAGATGGGAAEATATSGGAVVEPTQAADLSAGGTPEDVAADLRRKGFSAAVEQDQVVVHGATKAQVREALADRGPGDVEVVVKNP